MRPAHESVYKDKQKRTGKTVHSERPTRDIEPLTQHTETRPLTRAILFWWQQLFGRDIGTVRDHGSASWIGTVVRPGEC